MGFAICRIQVAWDSSRAVRLRSSWRLIGQRLGQRDEEFLSGAPAGNGTLVDRLPHLHSTRGSHQPLRLMEGETGIVAVKPAMGHQPRLAFKIVESIAPAGRT
jgi:hypothetical protein